LAKGHSKSLECGLCLVVVVFPLDVVDVEGHPRLCRERLEDVRDHLARQLTDLLSFKI
jgi:hypothetical protein